MTQKIQFNHLSFGEKQQLRVIQKNLVYIVNIDPMLSQEALQSNLFLSQYGRIKKIIIKPSIQMRPKSAYVTFQTDDEALDCLISVSESFYNNYQLKAQFGTSKFCNFYLNGQKCSNADCLFLHEYNDQMQMFMANSTVNNGFNQSKTQLPEQKINYEKNKSQQDGFPPSYQKIQIKQFNSLTSKPDNDDTNTTIINNNTINGNKQQLYTFEKQLVNKTDIQYFIKNAQMFSTIPFQNDFLFIGGAK